MIRDWVNHICGPGEPIRRVMEIMDRTATPLVMVIQGGEGKLAGTISDGDVRRWLLSGGSLEGHAENVMNVTPFVDGTVGMMRPEIPSWCTLVPVVGADGHVVGLRDLRTRQQSSPAVIIAGGLGTRLKPLTDDTPKPMLLVGGKPILQRLVEQFVAQGFTDVWISIGYKGDVIRKFFTENPCGANIKFIEDPEERGTAGALAMLPKIDCPVLVINGDVICDVDFRKIVDFHTSRATPATMAVTQFKMAVPYGVINVQPGGTALESVLEKPYIGFYVNAGIYVLSPSVLETITPTNLKMTDVFSLLCANLYSPKPEVFLLMERWVDIGDHASLARARQEYGGI